MKYPKKALALSFFALSTASVLAAPVQAQSANYLQCVPVARELSGVQIFGDARTWWDQAHGRYSRGQTPRKGAVMVFRPHRNMRLGHVAYVSEVIDSRTVRLTHANWSEINGVRGQIERDVPAVDVSPNNDWSEVRVWYHSTQGLGGSHWPLRGFIYADGESGDSAEPRVIQASAPRVAPQRSSALPVVPPRRKSGASNPAPVGNEPSFTFQIAFAGLSN